MDFVLKGDFIYSKSPAELAERPDSYLVCVGGVSQGIFDAVPAAYQQLPLYDHSGCLILPGMIDLHLHAPQYAFHGMYMDEELLEWLQKYTFVEEARYASLDYARQAYRLFAAAMKRSATTRAVVFGTLHREATLLLMDELESTGLISYVGKVNMDSLAPDDLLEPSAEASLRETRLWLEACEGRFVRTRPILTPRFIPSCSRELLTGLGQLVRDTGLPVQSHLSENRGEVELVQQLIPESSCYGDAYARYGLFGQHSPTIMAHCVYSTDEEIDLLRRGGVYVAHCPSSNINLSSGIAPIRRYLTQGLRVGLGSDVAAGESLSIFGEIARAVQVSKLYRLYVDRDARPLTFPEAFWLATLSGGSFFGKVGSFEPGYEVDAVVLDDASRSRPRLSTLAERLERAVYLHADRDCIAAKFAGGERII